MSATEPRPRKRSPIYATIAGQIRELAVRRKLVAGDRLPPERELARQLGVSRTSLREALTALRIDGFVDVLHGNGIYLLRDPTDTIPPIAAELNRLHPELSSLGEVRNALETLAAELAATRRTDADLAQMVAGIRQMEEEIGAGADGVEGDRSFHAAVLEAAHNPVLEDLLGSIADGSARIATASLARSGQPPRSLAAHRMIMEATVIRDAESARRLMKDHLELTGEIDPLR